MRRVHICALLVTTALALGGCTASGPSSASDFQGAESDVAKVVDDFSKAASTSDADKICTDLLTSQLANQLKAGASDCTDQMKLAVKDAGAYDLEVRDVTISGATARAQVRQSDDDAKTATFELARQGTSWRITSFGG